MIELAAMMWTMAVFFGIIGAVRGFGKEVVGTAGVVLALFTLFQFDSFLRGIVLANFARDQVFIIQALIFLAIIYFAYENRTFTGGGTASARATGQERVLGAIIGFLNGYLIWGSLWYFMDINEYPLAPYIIAPSPNSVSAQQLDILPLVLLAGGPGGTGDLLAVAVIILFVLVLVRI